MGERPETLMHVGVIGLGAGTLAAYGREGDRYQFYEIDPDVISVARDDGYFSYLADSAASIEVVPGDARLSLEAQLRDSGSEEFDSFIIDAFSSDAIPVHLLTLEAMQLYVRHLKPDGVLAVHISNLNLDLGPLAFRLAAELGMHAVRIRNRPLPRRKNSPSVWMILSRDAALVDSFSTIARQIRATLNLRPNGLTVTYPHDLDLTDAPLWTDDYSDFLAVLSPNWRRIWAAGGPR